ncbi:MAG: hypothetical protein HYT93_00025 [Parcubacteria group bacterium]|nr:hypothetical protein [Parcubacteria group bacterium]
MKNFSKSHLILGISFIVISLLFFFIQQSKVNTKQDIVDMRGKNQVSVILTEKGFEPRYVKISLNTEIVFSSALDNKTFWPASNLHPTHDIYPEFDSKGPIQEDNVWSFVFKDLGAWGFHDHIRSYFNGIIYVE